MGTIGVINYTFAAIKERKMMRSKALFRTVLLGIIFFYLPYKSMAWGMLGHRIVGEIADTYLTSKARAEIRQILGTESIAMASNWPDFIKSDTTYEYLNSWHYIDFDSALSYTAMQSYLKRDTSADAYTKLNFLIKELKNKNLAKSKKLMYLRLLIHIAGDVHQPFHAARHGDMGGNEIKVSWFGAPSNIHRVWDQQLIDFQQLSYTEYTKAVNHISSTRKASLQKQPISKWLFDSYTISEQLHRDLRQPDQKLSYQYNFKHIDTLNEQLLKGGVHLAGLLNEIFG